MKQKNIIFGVEDFHITHCGVLITHVVKTENGIQLWSGHPIHDKFAEEILADKSSLDAILDELSSILQ